MGRGPLNRSSLASLAPSAPAPRCIECKQQQQIQDAHGHDSLALLRPLVCCSARQQRCICIETESRSTRSNSLFRWIGGLHFRSLSRIASCASRLGPRVSTLLSSDAPVVRCLIITAPTPDCRSGWVGLLTSVMDSHLVRERCRLTGNRRPRARFQPCFSIQPVLARRAHLAPLIHQMIRRRMPRSALPETARSHFGRFRSIGTSPYDEFDWVGGADVAWPPALIDAAGRPAARVWRASSTHEQRHPHPLSARTARKIFPDPDCLTPGMLSDHRPPLSLSHSFPPPFYPPDVASPLQVGRKEPHGAFAIDEPSVPQPS